MGKTVKGKDLYKNSLGKNIGVGVEDTKVIEIFKGIAETIGKDETISLSFIGYNGFKNRVETNNLYAYVLSDKNLYMGHTKDLSVAVESCALKDLRDVGCRWGYNWSVMVLDKMDGELRIGVPTHDVEKIATSLWTLGGFRWDVLKVPEDMRMSMEQSQRLHSILAR